MADSLRPRESNSPLRESVRVLGLYIRAQALIALILTVLYAIGFAIADVHWWPAIAIAGGLASVIPHFGGFVPLILAVIADLLGDRSLMQFAIMFGVWLAVSVLEGFVITPRLLSKPLGLRPLLVFVVAIASSFLLGPIGFFLALPALAVIMVFWRYFRDR